MSLDLTLGVNVMGGECACVNQMVLWVAIHCLKSSSVETWLSPRWSKLLVVWTKRKKFLCCSVFEWGTKNGIEFSVACLSIDSIKSIMFFAVKS